MQHDAVACCAAGAGSSMSSMSSMSRVQDGARFGTLAHLLFLRRPGTFRRLVVQRTPAGNLQNIPTKLRAGTLLDQSVPRWITK
jgi:hypothetical protein